MVATGLSDLNSSCKRQWCDMAVIEIPSLQLGPRDWLLRYSSDLPDPIFRIYRNGKKIATTIHGQHHVVVDSFDRADFEILDTDEAAAYNVPYRGTIWWYGNPVVAYYLIEQWIDPDWVQQAEVFETGEPIYRWQTGVLPNNEESQFRIRAFDHAGNESAALYLSKFVVRRPETTKWSWSYDSGTGQVTVDEVV